MTNHFLAVTSDNYEVGFFVLVLHKCWCCWISLLGCSGDSLVIVSVVSVCAGSVAFAASDISVCVCSSVCLSVCLNCLCLRGFW